MSPRRKKSVSPTSAAKPATRVPNPPQHCRVITIGTLRDYQQAHPDAAQSLQGWYDAITHMSFGSFTELRALVPAVDYVNSVWLVFNIKGGDYRLITTVRWTRPSLYLHEFLSHTEYDAWTAYHTSREGQQADANYRKEK